MLLRRDAGIADAWDRSQSMSKEADGMTVNGYLLWSAKDKFERIWGCGDRFGIVYVEFDTLERTPKLSAEWFRETAKQSAVA
jgi:beta-glucosidase